MSIIGVQQISRWSLYTILSIPLFFVHIFLCILGSVDEIMREKFGMSRRKKIHTQKIPEGAHFY